MSVPMSLVIATYERPADLAVTLKGVAAQSHQPGEVVVVDSSRDEATRAVCREWEGRLPVRWVFSNEKSAARQRNQGADMLGMGVEVIGFMDDDITLYPTTCAEVGAVFAQSDGEKVGGVAVRIDEIMRPAPSRWTRAYYRLQAGYADETYGGRLFGPAINCLPCYTEPTEPGGKLIRGEWLNSGCVFYRRDVFLRERFPAFEGYSFMEDVHCSARIGKTHRLYFHTTARCSHREGMNSLKRDTLTIARQRIVNQRLVARDVMGLRGPELAWKFTLHRLFATLTILRTRQPGWVRELQGTWL